MCVLIYAKKKMPEIDNHLHFSAPQRFVENANVGACHNELLMLEQGEVQLMFKLRATSCLFSAIENSHDAVEIATLDPDRADHQVEVKKNLGLFGQ